MKIKDLPNDSKPRERFLKYGPEALSDAELFAIILRTGNKNENVLEVANKLIAEYGIDKLFDCSVKELRKIKGIGKTKAIELLTIAELAKRYSSFKREIKHISSAKDVFDLYHERLKDEKQENFYVLMLNNKNNIIKEELISKGVLDSAIIHPREVFKPAIKNSSARIILIHNHPSGDPKPSEEDVKVTKQIKEASKFVSIELVDHIIVGREDYYSFKQKFLDF
jgi:DNA repair protein RadC